MHDAGAATMGARAGERWHAECQLVRTVAAEGRLSGCRFYRTPGELPSHGRDEFHGKKDSRHARVEVWIDEPGTDYVIRKTVINSVRLGI